MKAFGLTDTGKKREKNEDSILLNPGLKLYIVADGMGGHSKGEVASRTAVNVINEFFEKNLSDDSYGQDDSIVGLLREAVSTANQKIYNYSQNQPGQELMGTTVTLALIRNHRLYTAHVGDSRIYRVRNVSIEKLTTDHNEVQKLVDLDMISEDEAEKHHLSHVLTKALGSHPTVEPDFDSCEIEMDDIFLLSSDGLFRVLTTDDVKEVLAEKNSPEEKCSILVEKTLEGGAPDNVSVILLETEKKDF